ncbi:hypothetical protein AAXE64_07545 [Priestia megaterium]
MNNAEYLEVVFENCESIVIPIEQVKKLDFGELSLVSKDYPFYDESTYNSSKLSLHIEYKNESDLVYDESKYREPLGMFVGNPTSNYISDRPNILGRILNHKDITCIELLDEKEELIKMIYIPWSDENEYNNMFMKTAISNNILMINIVEEEGA